MEIHAWFSTICTVIPIEEGVRERINHLFFVIFHLQKPKEKIETAMLAADAGIDDECIEDAVLLAITGEQICTL